MHNRVYIIDGDYNYIKLFNSRGFKVVTTVEDADIVCFTGGEDVAPMLYGEKKHPTTYFNIHRDEREKKIFLECVEKTIPMVGICRGGQFLNVMNGGKMYQHVGDHAGQDHIITDTRDDTNILASSTHHQMMRRGDGSILIAYAQNNGFKEHMEGDKIVSAIESVDAEVIFYPLTGSLCFQPHPEFIRDRYEPLQEYFFKLVYELLLP